MSDEDTFMMGNEAVAARVLPSGTKVLCETIKSARSVSLGVWLPVGSRNDPQRKEGISHFIEHLFFKGTENRTARQISEEIDSVGGQLNAFTAKEHTCVYAKVLDDDFSVAAGILKDMVTNSTFEARNIELERGVILDEIATYEDAPDELVLDLLESVIWDDHPMGRPILGCQDAVSSIRERDIRDHFRAYYGSNDVLVTACGNISIDRVVDELGEGLSLLGRHDRLPVPPVRSACKKATRVRAKQVEQIHFCLGAPGLKARDPRQYTMHVLNGVLGGGASSRLFQRVREEKGLAYSIYSFHSSYRDTGVFGVYAASNPHSAKSVKAILEEEMAHLGALPASEAEIERARRQLKGSLILGLEGTSGRMMRLARSELLLGRVVPLQEVIKSIEAVESLDVMELAREILNPARISTVAVGAEADQVERTLGIG